LSCRRVPSTLPLQTLLKMGLTFWWLKWQTWYDTNVKYCSRTWYHSCESNANLSECLVAMAWSLNPHEITGVKSGGTLSLPDDSHGSAKKVLSCVYLTIWSASLSDFMFPKSSIRLIKFSRWLIK
jgi:hypothetical protein